MSKIEIKNFGPIKDLSLDIKDFMVLVGPQASGKSTIAKTIFFFRSLNDDLVKYFIDAIQRNNFSKPLGTYAKAIRQKFLDYFGTSNRLEDGLHLQYYYTEEIWISITIEPDHKPKYISPNFSEQFIAGFNNLVQKAKNFSQSISQRNPSLLTSKELLQIEADKRNFISRIEEISNSIFHENRELIFIPAGRSLLATLSTQLQFIRTRNLDFLTRTFLEKINIIRPIFNNSLSDIIKEREFLAQHSIDHDKTGLAEAIINKILKGQYQYDKRGEERILIDANRYVKLNFASSGQQEALWILLLLFLVILEKQSAFIVIEEPEAHLFPEAQMEISKLIALASNVENTQVIITTHSPYILASINNLILASKVGSENNEVENRIHKNFWIKRDKVYAAMVTDGQVEDIMDNELNIIQQEKIDSVTETINDEFDFLFQLEKN